jgi:hypothetical protein
MDQSAKQGTSERQRAVEMLRNRRHMDTKHEKMVAYQRIDSSVSL